MSKINKVLPHGKIQKLFENIWFIQGQVKMPMILPLNISKTMTIIKNPNTNELTLINAMALDENGLREISSLGDIKNTLRVGGFHGKDDNFYKEKFNTKVYALKGHAYSRKFDKVPINPKDGYLIPDVLLDENSDLPILNASLKIFKTSHPIEAILHIHQDGGILVSADSLHNTPHPDEFFNLTAKLIMKKMGFFKAYNVGPGWFKFARPSKDEVRSILDLEFNHVLPGHGQAVIGNAKEKYRIVIDDL